jgi:hypothetical protein
VGGESLGSDHAVDLCYEESSYVPPDAVLLRSKMGYLRDTLKKFGLIHFILRWILLVFSVFGIVQFIED